MDVYSNAKRILERVAEASFRAGRAEPAVLVAASKMNGYEALREAYRAGVRLFGENRVQELLAKDSLGAYEGAEKHFIGHLQKNKVKDVAGRVDLIQSVDSPELIDLISARAEHQRILIEVNIASEPQKSGVLPEELPELAARAAEKPGILLEGLMAIPPQNANVAETCRYFEKMHNLFIDIGAKKYDNVTMTILSMGMSRDFEEAIAAGANMVRVGVGIFGERDYGQPHKIL